MRSIAAATVEGYNEFINGQKAAPGTADVLLAQFDHEYLVVYDKPLLEVQPLTAEDFIPRGNTALRDAIGITIDRLGVDIAAVREDQRPDSVTIVIITDGHENASRRYSPEKIADMIKLQTEKYNWKFVYLGATEDAILIAAKLNIPAGQALQYANSAKGTRNSFYAASGYSLSNRAAGVTGQSSSFSDEDRAAAMAPDDPAQVTTTSSGGAA